MLHRNLNVVLIEDKVAWADKGANLAQLEHNMSQLPEGTDLVVLPELFTTGFITSDRDLAASLAERNTGETISRLHELAKKYRTAIVGTFLAATAGLLYNRAFFIEPNGEDTFYDKRHLFSIGGEANVFKPGIDRQSPVVRFRGLNIKLAVCYDLRFPVFLRNGGGNDYDVLLVMANWPVARQMVWTTLLAARAIENQCYVCGVNICGSDGTGLDYGVGSSMVFDYKGRSIGERAAGSPIVAAGLNPDRLEDFRNRFPVWRDADPFSLNTNR